MSKSPERVEHAVSVDYEESCGVYESTIVDTNDITITLTNATKNGFPSPSPPSPQDILNVADNDELKIIDEPPSESKHTHKTDAVPKTSRISVRKDLHTNESSSGANIDPGKTCQAPSVVAMVAANHRSGRSGLTVVRYSTDPLHSAGPSVTSDVALYTPSDIRTAATNKCSGSKSRSRRRRQPDPIEGPTNKRSISVHFEDANIQSLTTPEEALFVSAGTTCASAKKSISSNDRSSSKLAAGAAPKRPRCLFQKNKAILVSAGTSTPQFKKSTGSPTEPTAGSSPKRPRCLFPVQDDGGGWLPTTLEEALRVSAGTPTAHIKKSLGRNDRSCSADSTPKRPRCLFPVQHDSVRRSPTPPKTITPVSTDKPTARAKKNTGSGGRSRPTPAASSIPKRPPCRFPIKLDDANEQPATSPEKVFLVSNGTPTAHIKKSPGRNDRSCSNPAADSTHKRPRCRFAIELDEANERPATSPEKVTPVSTDKPTVRAKKNTGSGGRSRPAPAASSIPKRPPCRFPIKLDDANKRPATSPEKAMLVSNGTPTARAKKSSGINGRLLASPKEPPPVSAGTPAAAASGSAGSCSSRRPQPAADAALKRPQRPSPFYNILLDSESESEDEVLVVDEEELVDDTDLGNMRLVAKKLREYEVYRQERETEALAKLMEEAEAIRIEEGLPEPDDDDKIEIDLVGEWGHGDSSAIRVLSQGDGVRVTNEGAEVGNLAECDGAEIKSEGDGVGVLTESVGVGILRKGDEFVRDIGVGVLAEGAGVGNLAEGEGVGIQSVGDGRKVLGQENNIKAGAADGGIDSKVFSWSDDFSKFSGQEEQFLRNAGPNVPGFDLHSRIPEPIDLFIHVWDRPIMELIVSETNKYAQQIIDALVEQGHPISTSLNRWKETTVDEMYRLFAILNYMSLDHRGRIDEYWTQGVLGMHAFRKIMSRNRFIILSRFLHFVDNYNMDAHLRPYDKKLNKIRPILDHCVQKFTEMYVPKKHLSLDESLLLWKGRLSWVQCIRSKKARFGIKSFELCEAESGYLLACIYYAGKDSAAVDGAIHEFGNPTAKVVLQLMESYLDLGHCLVMDNWYNQLVLTRFLKTRRTDVIGTMNRQRENVPSAIKKAEDKKMQRGDIISRHCGDVSLVAWKDVKLVTTISTFHNADSTVVVRRPDKRVVQPKVIQDYNKYMGGVDLKDQKLSLYKFERVRNSKWHIKVFRRLLNTSFLNSYILYTKYPHEKQYSHRQFRYKISEELLKLCPRPYLDRLLPAQRAECGIRLDKQPDHYPAFIERGQDTRKKRRSCARCSKRGVRKCVYTICTKCGVALCLGQCWIDYHTRMKLTT